MPAPGYQVVNMPVYGVNNIVDQQLTFNFGFVPQGYTYTVSFLPCVFNAPQTGGLVNTLWRLQRNGVDELTWFGNTIVRDIQIKGGEQITLVCFNNATANAQISNFTPVQTLVTMRGFSVPTGTEQPANPTFSNTGDSVWLGSYDASTRNAATGFSTAVGAGDFLMPAGESVITGIQTSVSINQAGVGLNGIVQIVDTFSGNVLWQQGVAIGATTSGFAVAQYVPLNQYQFNSAGGAQLLISWSLTSVPAHGAGAFNVFYNPY